MPALNPFRKSITAAETATGSDDSGESQPVAPPRRAIRMSKVFGKHKNKFHESTKKIALVQQEPGDVVVADSTATPVPHDSADPPLKVGVDINPSAEKADSIAAHTEHTVTSVGSDVTSMSEEDSVQAVEPVDISKIAKETPSLVQEPEVAIVAEANERSVVPPACYLVYEQDSSGVLVEHASKTPVEGAEGRWVTKGLLEVGVDTTPAAEKVTDTIAAHTEYTETSVGSDVTSSSEVVPVQVVEPVDLTKGTKEAPSLDEETQVVVVSEEDEKSIVPLAGCLVEEPDSSGRLVEHHSKTLVEGAGERWVAKDPLEVGVDTTPSAVRIRDTGTGHTEHKLAPVGSDVASSSEEDSVEPVDLSKAAKEAPCLDEEPLVVIVEEADEKSIVPPACYLVYEPDSSGRLVEHYSKTPVEGAVGRWVAKGDKKIAGFKFTRNAGRNVLIGNCSAGVQGRKNYCNGWCQFVKSCKILQGDVIILEVPKGMKALPVDVYLYYNRPSHQTHKLEPGSAVTTDKILAVACLPKSSPFFIAGDSVDVMKWLQDARAYGYSTKI